MKNQQKLILINREPALKKKKKPEKQTAELIISPVNEFTKDEERIWHLATIVECSEDAIISKSLTGVIKTWNKGSEKMFGYTATEAIGQPISLIIPPDYMAEEREILARIRNNERIDHYETVRNKKNGEQVYVSLTVSPLKDPTGKIIGVSKIARDITSRKISETQLIIANKELAFQYEEKAKMATELKIANIQSKNRLKEVSDYNHALDESSIVAITDQKGIIRYVNNNFCKISKYSADELIGNDHRIINSGYHSKEFIRNLWVTIANGQIWRGELKNKAKDGTIYWVDTTIVPFLNEQGKPYQYVALRADITQRKLAEEEVRFLNDDLERRVKERTEDLESFSYSVSHDLRSPLRAVNGYAQILKEKYGIQFDQEGNRLINNIVNNANKMGHLIDDLLTFSRLGRREMTIMDIPMNEIVTNLCIELKSEQDHRNIEFHIKPLLPVKADNIGIKQVWLNLISNAIKYTRLKEKAIIEIGSEINGDDIIYYIKDNGVGFNMRYVDKLFNIFQRLHSDEEFEGTGIGLAIVQRIIQKHGGRVWAVGQVNEEAIFYFSLNKS